jgi:hypothetical protein
MAPLVETPERVALAAWAELRARRARTRRPCSAVPAGSAETRARQARARRVSQARRALQAAARAALAAPVVLAERAVIAASAVLVAAALQGRAALVVWAWPRPAALVAVAARAAPGSMRAASTTVRQVVMPALAALVERAAPLARLARTPRRWSAVLAGLAVTLAWRARARRVSAA